MQELLRQTLSRLQAGETVVWCVILRAEGSTPRGVGAKMAVFADGASLGTVGGGAVELQAAALARTVGARAVVRSFDLYSGGTQSTGMVCGGIVAIAFLPLSPAMREPIREAFDAVELPGSRWIGFRISADGSFSVRVVQDPGFHALQERSPLQPSAKRNEDGSWNYTEPISRNYRVYIFGAGHVSAALAPVLLPLEFPVTVLDERPELAKPERFPGAKVLLCDFSRISETVTVTERDYAVVMTPGHQKDLEVLRQILRTPACYVGCIGSRKKTAYVNEMLRADGFPEQELARIHAPIGLPIKARTPAEIAVSIAAELILHRAGG